MSSGYRRNIALQMEEQDNEAFQSEIVEFTVFDAETGRAIRPGSCPRRDVQNQPMETGQVLIEGYHPATASHEQWLEVREDGSFDVVLRRRSLPSPTVEEVKREQARRLAETDWAVVRSVDTGRELDPDTRQDRNFIREAAHRLESMDPIPDDYKSDRYWVRRRSKNQPRTRRQQEN